MNDNPPPVGAFDLSENQVWRPCIMCNGAIAQMRKARFVCQRCSQEYISTEEDMRPGVMESHG